MFNTGSVVNYSSETLAMCYIESSAAQKGGTHVSGDKGLYKHHVVICTLLKNTKYGHKTNRTSYFLVTVFILLSFAETGVAKGLPEAAKDEVAQPGSEADG